MKINLSIYKLIFILFIILFFKFKSSHGVTIMSVDFGSEFMKVAVVAPGIPMEIALNFESKRKSPVAVSFRDGERSFGDDALSAGMKSPALSYVFLLDLLGKSVDNPMVEIHKQRFPYYKIEADAERNTVVFRQDGNTTYSVEELVAQILNHAREIAMGYTDQKIKDIVITVPTFFNQAERRALLNAAELAGLKVLSLMNSNAAVALNYGMFRRKEINETAQNIIFYDMGSSCTTATIASYQTVKTKERGYAESNPQVSILGVGYDRTLGGLEMQLRMRDFLAKQFNSMKKTPNDVFKSPRSMAKLMKEAGKLKIVLSANSEHLSQVEGVLDDKDFRLSIKREEFEALCSDLFERVRGPIDDALVSAAMDISNIHQFIIVGGNTRIPKIQSILQEVWGKELGKNINADEAASLGAVYRAADLGQGFKVLKFHVKESVIYPIEVEFERTIDGDIGAKSVKTIKRSLFAIANSYPQKKVMTFNKHTADFGFSVNYGDLSNLHKEQVKSLGRINNSYVLVEGVTAAFTKNLKDEAESKGIKAHFAVDDSGILHITGIEAIFERNMTVEVVKPETDESTLSKIGSTLSKLFSGGENELDDAQANLNETKDEKKSNESETQENKDENKSNVDKDTKPEGKKEFKSELLTIKEALNFTINYLDLKQMTAESKKISMSKLDKINENEKFRRDKEKLKNTLESYILDIQDKLSQDEYIVACKGEDATQIKTLASELDDWLYDEGIDQEPSVYKERLKSLEVLFEPIKNRVKEHRERPEALKARTHIILILSMLGLFLCVTWGWIVMQRYFPHYIVKFKNILTHFVGVVIESFNKVKNKVVTRNNVKLRNGKNKNSTTKKLNPNELARLRRRAFWSSNSNS